jgi:hypothetical protein
MSGRWCGKVEQGTGVGKEAVSGVLGVDASFEGMSYERNFSLEKWKWISGGDLRHSLALC